MIETKTINLKEWKEERINFLREKHPRIYEIWSNIYHGNIPERKLEEVIDGIKKYNEKINLIAD